MSEWNTGRLIEEGRTYLDPPPEQRNIIDRTRRMIAGVIHYATGIFDSVVGDIPRFFQKKENRITLAPYSGDAPRLKLDVKETLSSIGNVFRGRIASILTVPLNILKTGGDAIADVSDFLGGVHRPEVATI